jgi:hypothetical protein
MTIAFTTPDIRADGSGVRKWRQSHPGALDRVALQARVAETLNRHPAVRLLPKALVGGKP